MSAETVRLRSELLRDALANGWHTPGSVGGVYAQLVPPERLKRWYQRLLAPLEPALPGGRLINHFTVGADPEFVCTQANGAVYKAHDLAMKAGLAFGADNNGRLVELRPAPSRSALSVLTSIWLTLRWMGLYVPNACNFNWRSGAYAGGDGLGGHVHLGRKQLIRREAEVNSLDRLTHLCFMARIFNREEGRLRFREARGAPRGEQYGRPGDIRTQPHGYEYRTLPSWMDSPWLAYFVLTTSKLVVAMPELLKPLTAEDGGLTNERARGWLRLLLSYFAPLDDDARLCAAILARQNFPQHIAGVDFKNNWGVFAGGLLGSAQEGKVAEVLPTQIPSDSVSERTMMDALLNGQPPEVTPLVPNWSPTELPDGYKQAIHYAQTQLAPNIGEFTADLAVHKDYLIEWGCLNREHNNQAFNFPHSFSEEVRKELRERLAPLQIDFTLEGSALYIHGDKTIPLDDLLRARTVILEMGVLPVWHIRDVRADSLAKWQTKKPKEVAPAKKAKILLRSLSA